MINILQLLDFYLNRNYTKDLASAKVCQDILLFEVSKCQHCSNVNIKGGVDIQILSNDNRCATYDVDIDFYKFSIGDESIASFVNNLNDLDNGISFSLCSRPKALRQQDYRGKRIHIKMSDSFNNSVV